MWIEPLNLQMWFVNVFSGDALIFTAVALFAIVSMSAFFRMNGLAMMFMVSIFLLMFSGYVPPSLLIFIALIGGLLVGYWVSQIVKYR
jgi:hypothetical protein